MNNTIHAEQFNAYSAQLLEKLRGMSYSDSTLAAGDIIAYTNYKLTTKEGRRNRYTFAGAEYFKRIQELDMYTTDISKIRANVDKLNLTNILGTKLV